MKQINKSPSYLVRNAHSYCFRLTIPKDLQTLVGRLELRYSLKTGYVGQAKYKARYLASQVQILFRYLRRNLPVMAKLSKEQIPELLKQYIKDRYDFLECMFTDERYLKEFDSYKYDGDDVEGFIENTKDNMANGRHQMAHYCSMFLTSGYDELEMLAENIKKFLKENGVDSIDKNSPAYKELSTKVHEAEAQILPLEADRLKTGISYKQEMPKLFPDVFIGNNGQVGLGHLKVAVEKPSIPLDNLIEEYKKRQVDAKRWRPNTVRNHQPKFNTMLQVLGNIPVNHITIEDGRRLAKMLELLPPSFAKQKPYKDISKLRVEDLQGKHDKVMDSSTRRGYLQLARSLFTYAEECEYVIKNPILSGFLPPKKRNARSQRYPFDDPADLDKIFNYENYIKACEGRPSRFWAPILMLYTGCRREEICQLKIEDVQRTETGIWFLNVMGEVTASDKPEGDDQMLKNVPSIRPVPLHPFIVEELKFPEYVQKIRRKPESRIFNDLKMYNSKYGHKLGDWFNRYIRSKKIGITDPKKVLESTRQNVADHLYKKVVEESLIEELEGRAGKTETSRRYAKGHRIETIYERCILVLDYKADLSHLKKSRFVVK